MFTKKIVFVIGAGASCEAGLPSGQDLKKQIAQVLDYQDGSPSIRHALTDHAHACGIDVDDLWRAGSTIAQAMPLALSIDNFLDAHRADANFEICGKLAIAQTILEAERKSKIYAKRGLGYSLEPADLEGTWYPKLFQLLTENVDRRNVGDLFANVAFVIFNYDRCLEEFLKQATSIYYALPTDESLALIQNATFVHPYGTVGPLLWQQMPDRIAFGSDIYSSNLRMSAARLRTFTEQARDPVALNALARAMNDAETIVFLGFAFHAQNMQLMRDHLLRCEHAFATAYGISNSDCGVIRKDILGLQFENFEIEIRNDLTCAGLFDQYWRSLRSA
jgi:hypothetical protein